MEITQSSTVPTLQVQGAEIPRIGLGTWELTGNDAEEGVRDALEIGYRHLDTARAYENEREVGTAIGSSGIDRAELFVTTKLWHEELGPKAVTEQINRSLRSLGLDYVDLLLIHWPNPEFPIAPTLEAMAAAREREKVLHLGVSNFPIDELDEALDASPAPIVANQVEMHPYLDQSKLLGFAAEREVAIEAYSPLAHGGLPGDETLSEIGERHGKSAVQVGLRWLLDHDGVIVLPRSTSHENRADNFDIFDFELDDSERERIAGLAREDGRQIDPPWAPDWD